MQETRRRRLGWTAVLTAVGTCYLACAWLWAAPYRSAPTALHVEPSAPLTAAPAPSATPVEAPPRPPERAEKAREAAPVTARKARTPPLSQTRNFLIVGLDRR